MPVTARNGDTDGPTGAVVVVVDVVDVVVELVELVAVAVEVVELDAGSSAAVFDCSFGLGPDPDRTSSCVPHAAATETTSTATVTSLVDPPSVNVV